jgi:hypothetical protein
MSPGAPVGMLESGTPGEPEGYELVMSEMRHNSMLCPSTRFAGWRIRRNVLNGTLRILPLPQT